MLIAAAGVYGENKTALVIGNWAYRHFQQLSNPRSEAEAMGRTLESIGFEVNLLTDGGHEAMYDALDAFEWKLEQRGGIGQFNYGGYGVQVDGQNYLLPVGKDMPDERRVKSRPLNLSEIMASMESAGTYTNIIILDACRDNPLPAESRSTGNRGLVKIEPPVNSIVVYSAEAGEISHEIFNPLGGNSGPLRIVKKEIANSSLKDNKTVVRHLQYIEANIGEITAVV